MASLWRTHSCVPCRHSWRHPRVWFCSKRSLGGVHTSVNAARRSACATKDLSCLFGDYAPQEQVHDHFLHGAVQILEQPALQVKVRLSAREEILNQRLEAGTAANKIDHARRDGA